MRHYSTREVADLLEVATWQIQRIFEDGDLPEPPRFAGKRIIAGTMLPSIIDTLRTRGYLKSSAQPLAVAAGETRP